MAIDAGSLAARKSLSLIIFIIIHRTRSIFGAVLSVRLSRADLYVRRRGVGRPRSTNEVSEQRWATTSGGYGGKGKIALILVSYVDTIADQGFPENTDLSAAW
jgi:hypothetical protein